MCKKRVTLVLNRLPLYRSLVYILLLIFPLIGYAQDTNPAGGVQYHDVEASANGYILFSPQGINFTYLIDKQGYIVNEWESEYAPGSALYLLDNGNLLRAGRRGRGENLERVIEEYTWDGELVWQYVFESPRFSQHHDIEPMPNGNILILAWEFIPLEEALELGFDVDVLESLSDLNSDEPPEEIKLDSIFELNPETDAIVWEWHSRDHLVQDIRPDLPNYGIVAEEPRRIHLNYHDIADAGDITHGNSIAYHAKLGLIILSVRSFSEIWVIDHSLTTEEAQGEKGDLLYRWGNPESYEQGTIDDRILYYQHDARWLDHTEADSTLTVFNNGSRQHEREQSQVIQFSFPSEWMTGDRFNPPEIIWKSESDFFAINMSGSQPLPNQNMLMTLAPEGRFVEITLDSEVVWEYINPVYFVRDEQATNRVFRATFYPNDFIGFEDKSLEPLKLLEVRLEGVN